MDDLNIEHVLAIIGALVPIASALAGLVNAQIRNQTTSGAAVSTALLRTGQILNFAAVNLDKVAQFGKAARSGQIVHTALTPAASPAERRDAPKEEPIAADVAPETPVIVVDPSAACPACGRAS
jgi:hypothetical protein